MIWNIYASRKSGLKGFCKILSTCRLVEDEVLEVEDLLLVGLQEDSDLGEEDSLFRVLFKHQFDYVYY